MDASTLQQILGSAEQAAAGGDYSSAEALLREAARLQESRLGPDHPDLASTFNNLAIICEKSDRLAAAEEFYGRAFSIASASLSSDHPLVTTSRNNLDEFRRAHSRIAESAPTQGSAEEEVIFPAETTISQGSTVSQEISVEQAEPDHRAVERSSRRMLLSGALLVVVVFVALAIWSMRSSSTRSNTDEQSPPSAQEVRQPSGGDASAKIAVRKQTNGDTRVIEASLCQSLSTSGARWGCSPPDSSPSGLLYFYTRIAASRSVQVHHRWYRNGRLRQDVTLTIDANPASGYRTYSRQRVDGGEWKMELVTADGMVLHEENIAIR